MQDGRRRTRPCARPQRGVAEPSAPVCDPRISHLHRHRESPSPPSLGIRKPAR
uniref:Uncharacterized protein n=1 Tax=Triticum urartu TaxID=4572 RepID=A0A8R7Q1T2_TRIUA